MRRADQFLRVRAGPVLKAGLERVLRVGQNAAFGAYGSFAGSKIAGPNGARRAFHIDLPLSAKGAPWLSYEIHLAERRSHHKHHG
jgi:hypothetical protein